MPEAIAQTTTEQKRPDFGHGPYSSKMEEVYKDSMRVFKLESPAAEKFARQVATELGALRAQGKIDVWFGKLNKDGKTTVYDASKVKGVTMTNTLLALKAIGYANDAGKHGFSCGKTVWAILPDSELENYLLNL